MIMRVLSKYCVTAAATVSMGLFAACFTGIESTPKISAEKVERSPAPGAQEEALMADIAGEPPARWKRGKEFTVTDPRISIIFDPGAPEIAAGDTLRYVSTDRVISILGEPQAQLRFETRRGGTALYTADISDVALAARPSFEIPFTVEQSVVAEVGGRLEGKRLFVLTPMWYDGHGQSFTGRKFVPAVVERVVAGNTVYPVRLVMREEESGYLFDIFMSVGSNLKAPRSFHKLFSLTDPHRRYPLIKDNIWQNIINGRVARGMTLDECRLALGAPASVKRRPTTSALLEMWTYENGRYLLFQDGILEEFR